MVAASEWKFHWASFAPAADLSRKSRLSGSFSGINLPIPVPVNGSAVHDTADNLMDDIALLSALRSREEIIGSAKLYSSHSKEVALLTDYFKKAQSLARIQLYEKLTSAPTAPKRTRWEFFARH